MKVMGITITLKINSTKLTMTIALTLQTESQCSNWTKDGYYCLYFQNYYSSLISIIEATNYKYNRII